MNRFGLGVRIAGYDVGPWVVEGGSIEYGRSTVFEQPGAPTCHLTLFTREGWPQNPDAWFDYGVGTWGDTSGFNPAHDADDEYIGPRTPLFIGAPVWVAATTTSGFLPDHDTQDTYMGAEFRRFTGKVQAIEYSRYRLDIVCAGDLEEWARIGIMEAPSLPFDVEADTARALDLAYRAGAPTTLHIEGNDGPLILSYTTSDYPICLLVALQAIADDADGLLYQNREGNVTYRTHIWEGFGPTEYAVPSGIVNAETLDMVLELGSAENTVVVEWGDPADYGGYQPIVQAQDSALMQQYGVRRGYYTSQLTTQVAADFHAHRILQKQAPAWHLPDVELHMNLATDRQVYDVCGLEQGDPVGIFDLPPGAPVPEVRTYVLGFTEDLTANDWVITMHLAPAFYDWPENT